MIVAVALSAFAVGCGKSITCKDFCEKGNACDTSAEQVDCDQMCSTFDNLNEASGCGSDFDDLLACADEHLDDICDYDMTADSTICSAESVSWLACMGTYCSAHTDDPACYLAL